MKILLGFLFCCLNASAANFTLSWDPPVDAVTGWNVYEQIGTNWIRVSSVATTNLFLPNVGSGFHTYSVTATKSAGLESSRSVSVISPLVPNSPTNPKLSAVFQMLPQYSTTWIDVAKLDFSVIATNYTASYRVT